MAQLAQQVLPILVLDHYRPLTSSVFDKCTDNSTGHRDHQTNPPQQGSRDRITFFDFTKTLIIQVRIGLHFLSIERNSEMWANIGML